MHPAFRMSLLILVSIVGILGLGSSTKALSAANDHLLSPDNPARVSAHSWMIKGFPNIGIVVGKRATLVVDTGLGTRNGQIVANAALGLSGKGQKLYLTTTHYHAEHASGDAGFPPGTIVIRPRVQQAEMEAEGQKLMDLFSSRSEQDKELLQGVQIKSADVLFDRSYSLDLGDVSVKLYWFGPAHTKGDELILVEPDNVLFSGDVIQNKVGPYFYCSECTPRTWLGVVNQVERLHPQIVVPDHSPPGDGSLIASERDFLANLQARADALKSEGKSASDAGVILAAEFAAKYQGWTGLNHIREAVRRAYSDSGTGTP